MTTLKRAASCIVAITLASAAAIAQEPQQTTAVYDDWVVQCSLVSSVQPAPAPATKPGDKSPAAAPAAIAAAPSRSCEIVQTFILRETGGTIAKLAIGKVPARDEIKGVLIAPLGVYLGEGATLKLDANPIKGTYTRCDTSGCFAEFALTKETVAAIRAAKTVTLQFLTAQRAPMLFGVSLRGFAAAYDAAVTQTR